MPSSSFGVFRQPVACLGLGIPNPSLCFHLYMTLFSCLCVFNLSSFLLQGHQSLDVGPTLNPG